MAAMSRSIYRTTVLSIVAFVLFAIVLLSSGERRHYTPRNGATSFQHPISNGKLATEGAIERLDLTDSECNLAFPDLSKPFNDSLARGGFIFNKSDTDYKGLVQGRIKNNQLYVLSTAPDTIADILHQRTAILHQIHRALITSPERLPDTHFAFVINDSPKNNSWTFARENKNASSYNTWLMPHFGFWSWERDGLGAMDDILDRISRNERERTWEEKLDKPIWRGTVWFNPIAYPNLRKDLVKEAAGKKWANVEALSKTSSKDNSLRIEDFCKYKYVIYTEGVTYSGRLPYHQACESVLLTAPLTYLTTTAYAMRPISANDLFSAFGYKEASRAAAKFQPLLPMVKNWEDANAVYVEPNFSNLESTVALLNKNPKVAKRIARNQREAVMDRGLLSSSAESCYWRALIRAWASRADAQHGGWGDDIGERFESWMLKQVESTRHRARGRIGN